ncbi:DUF6146 family protein [Mesonia maritima]|uniref:Uncharacterized protein n=1 Tax=Mesonia maritima TaxID=1793873 RepID=A0ABU1K979_9FLAO|nr:DUF6146 family protein [Mesonia maritima]MDR6302161.1 hypothetical protein [Mesonia maritima]
MRYLISIIIGCFLLCNCATSKKGKNNSSAENISETESDTIRITNDSLEYEVIIFETGFTGWLATQPPRGHYSQTYLELKNIQYVTEYNVRARSSAYNRDLYPLVIDYDRNIDYGYEVNYLLYNYFLFFQKKYNQKL